MQHGRLLAMGLSTLLFSVNCSPAEGVEDVPSSRQSGEGTYIIEATFIGSLAVAASSEQQCGLNIPVKAAEYRLEVRSDGADVRVDVKSFGCSFPASRSPKGIVGESAICELVTESPLHGYGIYERRITSFEFDPDRDVLRMLYTDLARGMTSTGAAAVRYCGILEASKIDDE